MNLNAYRCPFCDERLPVFEIPDESPAPTPILAITVCPHCYGLAIAKPGDAAPRRPSLEEVLHLKESHVWRFVEKQRGAIE